MGTTDELSVMSALRREPEPQLTALLPGLVQELERLRRAGRSRWLTAEPCTGADGSGNSQLFEQVKMTVVLAGRREVWHRSTWKALHPGDVQVVPPRVAHRERLASDEQWALCVFSSDDELAVQVVQLSAGHCRLVTGTRLTDARGRLLCQLVIAVLADPRSPAALTAQTQALILTLLGDAARRPPARLRGGVFVVSACQRLIEARHDEPCLGLAELARCLECDPSSLARLYHRKTGLTVNAAIRQRRVLAAQRLLMCTTLGIDEIAGRCGFTRRDSFTRAFRALTSESPKTYRRLGHLEGEVLKAEPDPPRS